MNNTPLDEVELHLDIMRKFHADEIESKTYREITDIINKKFDLNASVDDVFLLHEPTIEELEEDLRIHFESMGLMY